MGARSVHQFLANFTRWASTRPDVRAALLIGSQARSTQPADAWSDVDIVIVTANADDLLRCPDWNLTCTYPRSRHDDSTAMLFSGLRLSSTGWRPCDRPFDEFVHARVSSNE
jgi:hypothetical protein